LALAFDACKTEVTQLERGTCQVTPIKEHVLWLEVEVRHAPLKKMLNCCRHLYKQRMRMFFLERSSVSFVKKTTEVTTAH
jgi:hypothetical protein